MCTGTRLHRYLHDPADDALLANSLVWAALIVGLAFFLHDTPDGPAVVFFATVAATVSLGVLARRRGECE